MREIKGQLLSVMDANSQEYNGMTTIEKTLLFEEGCLDYLPEEEHQIGIYFDSYGCASFSFNNALEVVADRSLELGLYSEDNAKWLKDNYSVNGKINFSDRDLVVISKTNPNKGNSSSQIFNIVKGEGLICETDAPWDFRNRDADINNKANYYNYKRTTKSIKKAQEFLKRFRINGEWVSRHLWGEASKYGGLQVYTRAWFRRENGKYYNPTPNTSGHAIMVAQKSTNKIFDQYYPFIKQIERDEDYYPSGFKLNLIEITMEKPKLENNTLVQEVTETGSFGLYLDGKIMMGEYGALALTFYMRNNGDTVGKVKALTNEQWLLFEKYDLMGKKL
jgi:hypothetical protein